MNNHRRAVPYRPALFFVMALLALLAFHRWAEGEDTAAAAQTPAPKRVQAREVRVSGEGPGIWFPGVARAEREGTLAFTLSGRLERRGPSLGERVAAGAEIARLSNRKQHLAIDAARAAHAEAEVRHAEALRDRARVIELVAGGAATEEELEGLDSRVDASSAAVRIAAAALGEAERRRDETILHAPWSGTVTRIFAEPGEFLDVGMPVLELAGDGASEVELAVPAAVAEELEPGATVAVRRPARGGPLLEGRLLAIGRAGGRTGALFPVRVALDAAVLAGTSVEVSLRPAAAARLTVPIDAVVDPSGRRPMVFRLDEIDGDLRVTKIAVRVGVLVEGWVTVEGDLERSHRVVVTGQRGLLDGDAVEIVP